MVTTVGVLVNNQTKYVENNSQSTNGSERLELNKIVLEVLPDVVRTVFEDFPVENIVGIQPMVSPVGLVYTLKYRYTKSSDDTEYFPSKKDDNGSALALEVVSQAIEAGSRNIPVIWTEEQILDLYSDHTLVTGFANALRDDLNHQILSDISSLAVKSCATDTENSSLEHYVYGRNNASSMVGKILKKAEGYPAVYSSAQASVVIHKNANLIARDTMRGAGTFAIVGRDVYNLFYREPCDRVFIECEEHYVERSSLTQVGTVSERITLYVSDDIPKNRVLVGYKGKHGATDTGYVYCPYIPLITAGIGVDPATFQLYTMFFTRYGRDICFDQNPTYSNSHNYYRAIDFYGLPTDEEKTETK